jgi:hypothetical protein
VFPKFSPGTSKILFSGSVRGGRGFHEFGTAGDIDICISGLKTGKEPDLPETTVRTAQNDFVFCSVFSLLLALALSLSLSLSRWISQEVLENKSFVVTETEFNRDFVLVLVLLFMMILFCGALGGGEGIIAGSLLQRVALKRKVVDLQRIRAANSRTVERAKLLARLGKRGVAEELKAAEVKFWR